MRYYIIQELYFLNNIKYWKDITEHDDKKYIETLMNIFKNRDNQIYRIVEVNLK